MERLNNTYKDRKFQMLAISVDNNWEQVHSFYKDYNLTLPAFLDPGHQVSNLYKVFQYPETFLIDGNGYVVKHTWAERWDDPRMMSYVESLIRKEEARAGQDKPVEEVSAK
jgi:peroxiredoxin